MNDMYPTVLTVHSILRWVVVILGVWAVASVLPSRLRDGRPATSLPGLLFSIALDVQMLLGLLLYVALSPITTAAMQGMGAAMKNGGWRFWSVEHPAMMIAAVVCAHVGRPRRGTSLPGKRAVLAYGLALLAILAATPWPFMSQGRPWIRLW
jgi:hypothetical protein